MNIRELAKQAGVECAECKRVCNSLEASLERFAALVRAEERERCAEVCDDVRAVNGSARDCAKDIRGMK